MNLPNKLTTARVIAVPFFLLAYYFGKMNSYFYLLALAIFVLASLTDLLDGKIAREQNLVTNFGKIMDPLADKILVYSALCLMVAGKLIYAWMLIIILAREFLVAGIRTVAAAQGMDVAAVMSGKIKTVAQMFAVSILILYKFFEGKTGIYQEVGDVIFCIGEVILWISVIMTFYSGVEYIIRNKSVFKG